MNNFWGKKQTDEEGDLFNWIKHQAQHGVLSAQVNDKFIS